MPTSSASPLRCRAVREKPIDDQLPGGCGSMLRSPDHRGSPAMGPSSTLWRPATLPGAAPGAAADHHRAGTWCGLIRSAVHGVYGALAGNTYGMDSTDLRCASWEAVNRVPRASSGAVVPAIKFFKDAVEDILTGRKTLEPRPRSASWIERLEKVRRASLTYGPRFGAPTVFATARIIDVAVRPFESVTVEDLARIGYGWSDRSCEEFVVEYTRWFAKELEKGYPVAWISFEVIDR